MKVAVALCLAFRASAVMRKEVDQNPGALKGRPTMTNLIVTPDVVHMKTLAEDEQDVLVIDGIHVHATQPSSPKQLLLEGRPETKGNSTQIQRLEAVLEKMRRRESFQCEEHVPDCLSVYTREGPSACHGPQLASPDVRLVVSAFDENIAWIAELDMPTSVYIHNRSSHRKESLRTHQVAWNPEVFDASMLQLHHAKLNRSHPVEFKTIPNIGDEAAAYLREILRVYDHPPDALVFVHGEQCSHNCGSSKLSILRSACLPKDEYLNLSPNSDTGCLDTSTCHHTSTIPHRTGEGCPPMKREWQLDKEGRRLSLLQTQISVSQSTGSIARGPSFFCESELRQLWPTHFVDTLGQLPQQFCIDGSAEFAISRSMLQSHPRSFYESLLGAVLQKRTSMEYFWRAVFARKGGSAEVLTSPM